MNNNNIVKFENKNELTILNNNFESIKAHIFTFIKEKKSVNTQNTYLIQLKKFFEFLSSINISDIKDVEYKHLVIYSELLRQTELSDNTINTKLATIKSFFQYLSKPLKESGESYIKNNVALHLKKEKVNPYEHSQIFDLSLLKIILKNIDTNDIKGLRDYCLLYTFFLTGLRKSEVRNLKVNSFYMNNGKVYYIVKGKGNKTIEKEFDTELYEKILSLIEKLNLKDNDYLFVNLSKNRKENKRIGHDAINYILNDYCKKYGIDKKYRVHSLRALSGVELYKEEKDIKVVKNHLNHSHINTTDIYLSKIESKNIEYYNKLKNVLN